ncbi:hypothetical protein AVT69_gp219 [Pseudomonas phage PhiPA3]|uniref:Uncharacterized protein 221 n=1 Tax=Pseudomonas phage PhiPA3 TaxID=998086 RepID=F8SJ64_BPPA3|nr:hypothetical protein AVT69_gp219 [Pseudomonas phage PhiPA3]AEH03644.1 hypothetical protein [Pseudomonas phage PhiPA3]
MKLKAVLYVVNDALTKEEIVEHTKIPFVENVDLETEHPIVATPYNAEKVKSHQSVVQYQCFIAHEYETTEKLLNEELGERPRNTTYITYHGSDVPGKRLSPGHLDAWNFEYDRLLNES